MAGGQELVVVGVGGSAASAAAVGGQPAGVETSLGYRHAAEVLIEAAKEAGLLVVGSHGHRAWAGMLLGSVTLHCVTGASCPVVVVPDGYGQH